MLLSFIVKGKKKTASDSACDQRCQIYDSREQNRAPLLLSSLHSQDSCWEMRNTHTSVCSDIREAASPGVLTFKTDTLGQETAA